MKILIVDDDHDLLEALGLGLQLQWPGVDIIAATDGRWRRSQYRLMSRPKTTGAVTAG